MLDSFESLSCPVSMRRLAGNTNGTPFMTDFFSSFMYYNTTRLPDYPTGKCHYPTVTRPSITRPGYRKAYSQGTKSSVAPFLSHLTVSESKHCQNVFNTTRYIKPRKKSIDRRITALFYFVPLVLLERTCWSAPLPTRRPQSATTGSLKVTLGTSFGPLFRTSVRLHDFLLWVSLMDYTSYFRATVLQLLCLPGGGVRRRLRLCQLRGQVLPRPVQRQGVLLLRQGHDAHRRG